MAKIQRVLWATSMPGQDLHVLAKKNSGRLGDVLAIIDDTPPPGKSAYTATSIPTGRPTQVKWFIESTAGPSPPGVTVFDNGSIGMGASNTLAFFNVRAEVSDSPTAAAPFATKPRIRVQVHNALVSSGPKFWLTPQTLSIHRGSDDQVLSAFAEFDDGTVGDVTDLPDLKWELVNAADASKLEVDDWGRLKGKTDFAVVPVRARLPADWGGLSATANVEVLPPWGTATTLGPLEAHLVAGSRAAKDKVPNFLFIPEGFTDRTQFVDTVTKIVTSLRTDERSSPFDWLKDDINYWFAWIPAPSSEKGTSVLHEMVMMSRSGRQFGVSPPTNKPTRGALLADERNSTLGLGVGGRLNLENQVSFVHTTWYPRRTQRAHLDGFLAALKDPDDKTPGAPNIGLKWTTGTDRGWVIALVVGAHFGGTRSPAPIELVAPVLDGAQEIEMRAVSAAGRRMEHVPYEVPKTPALNGRMVLAHEVCHALGLLDEYSNGGRRAPGALPALNLQDEASAKTGPNLDGAKIRWLWPRVERAAELTGAPTGTGPFTISVKAKQELAFDAEHLVVQLRSRALDPLRWSDLFRVSSKPAGQLVVTLEKAVPGSAVITTFKSRDLVIAPVLSPQTGLPLRLVHERIVAHITQTKQPLNAAKNPPATRTCDAQPNDNSMIQRPKNLPDGLKMPNLKETWRVVGLYEGGDAFMCGVYHATGGCVMRQALRDVEPADQTKEVVTFCPVCRYILVDKLEPTKHRQLDHWFARRYPFE